MLSLPANLEVRIELIPFTDCWIWTGRENRNGYGRLRVSSKEMMAHRLVYEALIGPIPSGLILDHTCRCRYCVNPHHLEPVTVQVNTLRGEAKLFGRDIHPITLEMLNVEYQNTKDPVGSSV